jgi:putative Ig domain-containing protein
MDTSVFACSGSACEVGPGNVGVPFAAGLNVTGYGVSGKEAGDFFRMTIISGSLPPGLQLSLPSSEWTVTGTPTKAGTYPFTVQFTPTQDIAPFLGTGTIPSAAGRTSPERPGPTRANAASWLAGTAAAWRSGDRVMAFRSGRFARSCPARARFLRPRSAAMALAPLTVHLMPDC